jgi:hypothetical protein
MTARVFEDVPAVRGAIPVLLGVSGAAGSGKTFSALRLAAGIQQVVGGDIIGCDSEANRMLHYADLFKFRHLSFGAPFGPLDYLAMLEHCQKKGAKTVIIDQVSNEHEGPGGVLEIHDKLTKELARKWGTSEEKASRAAWIEPKMQRQRFVNSFMQMPMNMIFCFRAKEKSGKTPDDHLGFQPVAGGEIAFAMTAMCLLYPGSDGVPTWDSRMVGEKLMTKLPTYYKKLFLEEFKGKPLSEDIGRKLAEWSAGGPTSLPAGSTKSAPANAGNSGTPSAIQSSEKCSWCGGVHGGGPESCPKPKTPGPTRRIEGTGPADPAVIEEIKGELKRLMWTTKQVKEWCMQFGCDWPTKLSARYATQALQALLHVAEEPPEPGSEG